MTLKSTCWPEPVRNHPGSGRWDPLAVGRGKSFGINESSFSTPHVYVLRASGPFMRGRWRIPAQRAGDRNTCRDNNYPLIILPS